MWKGETPEVRNKYLQKSLDIKAHLMALYPNYRYAPRKSSEICRRARRNSQAAQGQSSSPSRVQAFQHNAHRSPQFNNMKAGLKPTSQITRCVPGAQQFLPPMEAPGWTPYHLLPGATSPTAATLAEDDIAEEADDEDFVEEAPAQHALADDAMIMNGGQDFVPNVDQFINGWDDIDADLARLLADV